MLGSVGRGAVRQGTSLKLLILRERDFGGVLELFFWGGNYSMMIVMMVVVVVRQARD